MKGIVKLTLMELKLFLREPIAVLFTFALYPLMLFMFGAIWGNEPSERFGGELGMIDASLPQLGAILIASTGLMGIPINLATYREKRIFRRLRATPLRPWAIIFAHHFVNFSVTLLSAFLFVATAKLVYNLRFLGDAVDVFLAFILGCAAFFTVGFLVGGLAPTAKAAQAVGMVLFFPNLFLSGATLPKEMFPQAVKNFSRLIPLSYVVDLLRGLWAGNAWGEHLLEVAVLIGMLVIGVAVSAKTFRWE
jgi:ABC-2 type transport system permease protein